MLTVSIEMITEVTVTPIKPKDGLVAFASCVLNLSLYIGSIGIHKLKDGSGYRITYPTQKVGSRQLNYYHPITKYMQQRIEEAIIAKCVDVFERSDENDDRHSKITNKCE